MNTRNVVIAIVIVAIVVVSSVTVYSLYGTGNNNNTGTTNNSNVTLKESGSSLLYPVFNSWAKNYTNASITTDSTGSGTGISQAEAGTVQIGASDAYLQGVIPSGTENIPILISYQYICYNIPGLSTTLNLSAGIIAGMYMGKILYWDNAAINASNPGVSLPHKLIRPVHRSDGSGDTFMFTSFLSKGNKTWAKTVGTSVNPNWPSGVTNALTGQQNQGMVNTMKGTDYTVAYIAGTFNKTVHADGFGIANLLNKAGNYVAPTVANVKTAASGYLSSIPSNGTIALQFAPGATSYPIADMEYVIVHTQQSSTSIANALKSLLLWIVSPTGGSASTYTSQFDLAPLPSSVVNSITKPLVDNIS